MTKRLSDDELRRICFDLRKKYSDLRDLDFESLTGAKNRKIIELITYCERRDRIPCFSVNVGKHVLLSTMTYWGRRLQILMGLRGKTTLPSGEDPAHLSLWATLSPLSALLRRGLVSHLVI